MQTLSVFLFHLGKTCSVCSIYSCMNHTEMSLVGAHALNLWCWHCLNIHRLLDLVLLQLLQIICIARYNFLIRLKAHHEQVNNMLVHALWDLLIIISPLSIHLWPKMLEKFCYVWSLRLFWKKAREGILSVNRNW